MFSVPSSFTAGVAICLAGVLKNNTTLTKLDLEAHGMKPDVATALEQGLAGCENLKELILANNTDLNEKAIIVKDRPNLGVFIISCYITYYLCYM